MGKGKKSKKFNYYKKFIDSGAPFHPIRITGAGTILNLIGTSMLFFESTRYFAPLVLTSAILCDRYDGKIARKYKVGTKQGARADPIADKINYILPLSYIAPYLYENGYYVLLSAIGVNLVTNYVSQKFRGEIFSQLKEYVVTYINPHKQILDISNGEDINDRATWPGKVKAGIQGISNIVLTASIVDWFYPNISSYISQSDYNFLLYDVAGTVALSVSGALASKNIYDVVKKKGLENTLYQLFPKLINTKKHLDYNYNRRRR